MAPMMKRMAPTAATTTSASASAMQEELKFTKYDIVVSEMPLPRFVPALQSLKLEEVEEVMAKMMKHGQKFRTRSWEYGTNGAVPAYAKVLGHLFENDMTRAGCRTKFWALFYEKSKSQSTPHFDSREEGSRRLRFIANTVEGAQARTVTINPKGGRRVPYTRIDANGPALHFAESTTLIDIPSGGWWSLTSAGSGQMGSLPVRHGVPVSPFSTLGFACDIDCDDLEQQRRLQVALVEEAEQLCQCPPAQVPKLEFHELFLELCRTQGFRTLNSDGNGPGLFGRSREKKKKKTKEEKRRKRREALSGPCIKCGTTVSAQWYRCRQDGDSDKCICSKCYNRSRRIPSIYRPLPRPPPRNVGPCSACTASTSKHWLSDPRDRSKIVCSKCYKTIHRKTPVSKRQPLSRKRNRNGPCSVCTSASTSKQWLPDPRDQGSSTVCRKCYQAIRKGRL